VPVAVQARHFHPTSPVENRVITTVFRGMTAKLLEKKSDVRRVALITQIAEPIQ